MLHSEFIKDKFFDKYYNRYFLQKRDVLASVFCRIVTYYLQKRDVFSMHISFFCRNVTYSPAYCRPMTHYPNADIATIESCSLP